MNSKAFLLYSLLGTAVLLTPLPLFNYQVDQYRVLTKDYVRYYNNEPNKHYLKLHYLLNNPHNFSKFIFGSSRVKAVDTHMLGEEWYNMTYSLGIPAIHLYNLRLMVKNNLVIEEAIVAISGGTIWKQPADFDNDYLRRVYPDGLYDTLRFYKDYLYKKPTQRDVDILKGKVALKSSTHHILHPYDDQNIALEKKVLKNPEKHRNNIDKNIALLGYTGESYRIDEAVAEIKAIRDLCTAHDIVCSFVFMPVYKSVYDRYDQHKIQEFKQKLSGIIEFHDFYKVDELTTNPMYWRDTSHLFPSPTNRYITPVLKQRPAKASYE